LKEKKKKKWFFKNKIWFTI